MGVFVAIAGTFTNSVQERITTSAAGVFTYNAPDPRAVKVRASLTAEMASGGAESVSFQVHFNGSPVGVPFTVELTGNVLRTVAISALLSTVSAAQTIDLRAANNGGTVNVLVVDAEVDVTQLASGL